MTQPAALNNTAFDIAVWYYQTAPVFQAAYARRDWDTIAQLDQMEADLMARDAAETQFDPESNVAALYEEDEFAHLDWSARFDADLAA